MQQVPGLTHEQLVRLLEAGIVQRPLRPPRQVSLMDMAGYGGDDEYDDEDEALDADEHWRDGIEVDGDGGEEDADGDDDDMVGQVDYDAPPKLAATDQKSDKKSVVQNCLIGDQAKAEFRWTSTLGPEPDPEPTPCQHLNPGCFKAPYSVQFTMFPVGKDEEDINVSAVPSFWASSKQQLMELSNHETLKGRLLGIKFAMETGAKRRRFHIQGVAFVTAGDLDFKRILSQLRILGCPVPGFWLPSIGSEMDNWRMWDYVRPNKAYDWQNMSFSLGRGPENPSEIKFEAQDEAKA